MTIRLWFHHLRWLKGCFLLLVIFSVTSCTSQGVTSVEQGAASAEQEITSAEQELSSAEQELSSAAQELTSAEQELISAEQELTERQESGNEDYQIDIELQGGSGKASIQSPVSIHVENGMSTAELIWSSKNYDYLIVGGVRYENENPGGASTFHVPVPNTTDPLEVIGDTVAMSTPHEIAYTIIWGRQLEEGQKERQYEQEGAQETLEESPAEDTQKGTREEAHAEDVQNGTREEFPVEDVQGKESLQQVDLTETEKALLRAGLTKTGELIPTYAEGFRVSAYGDYRYIKIRDFGEYLLIPEGGDSLEEVDSPKGDDSPEGSDISEESDIPAGLPDGVTLLQKPLDRVYLVSTSAMDLIIKCGALDRIRLSGTKESDWYVPEAAEEMRKGNILYAGKYRAPDYERILEEGCDLAIENTMIYHAPAVQEKLMEFGIPVLVEASSYESHPLGRLEWIRLYGVLFDREAEADAYFEEQLESVRPLLEEERDTGKTVAFFHITAGGLVSVRRPGDYITKMIELAGGIYVPQKTGEGGDTLSTVNMQTEEFYAQCSEADVLIYNSTIGGEIASVEELVSKDPLLKDFKAVKMGQVYCTERNFFQQTTGVAEFMHDLDAVLREEDTPLTYLNRLE